MDHLTPLCAGSLGDKRRTSLAGPTLVPTLMWHLAEIRAWKVAKGRGTQWGWGDGYPQPINVSIRGVYAIQKLLSPH